MSRGLADRLLAAGLIKPEDADAAAELAPRAGKSLVEALVDAGVGDETALYREAAAQRRSLSPVPRPVPGGRPARPFAPARLPEPPPGAADPARERVAPGGVE
jgi:hypothetical protein